MSTTFCVAVGESFATASGGATRTLIESWNGTAWTVSTSPTPNAGSYPSLDRVSCVSATFCEATGSNPSAGGSGFIELWNGTAWTIATSPNTGTGGNSLDEVSCVSTTSCTTVGTYRNASGVDPSLIESWNGSSWTIATSPNTGTGDNLLAGVSCVSTTSCMAVGVYYGIDSGIGRILTESWNGSTWRRYYAPSPLRGPYGIVGLNSVSCASATSCQAVSSYAASHLVAFIESWDGIAWTVSSNPNPGTGGNDLSGVSCVSTTSCVAVGSYYNVNHSGGTLIESY